MNDTNKPAVQSKSLDANNQRILTIQDVKAIAMEKHYNDPLCEKINYLDQVAELIGVKLFREIHHARTQGLKSLLFLNFWTVKWEMGDNNKIELSSSCTATSSARNISNKFASNNYEINHEIHEYFYSILSKPPGFIDFITDISEIAKQNPVLHNGDISTGRHLAYLFNVLFSTILDITYTQGKTVHIARLGLFEKGFKVTKKKAPESNKAGYLQFKPEL